jgi:hypothetical protein
VAKRDLRSNPPPAIGCATHVTPQADMPCGMCRRQGELFTRATAAVQTRARRYQ